MKKIMFMHAIAMYAILIISDASCQTIKGLAKTEIRLPETVKQKDEVVLPPSIPKENMRDISIKVVREFIKKFGSAENVIWYKANDGGYVAQIKKDSIQTMVGYREDGSWNYMLKRYDEKRTSAALRTLVKSTFYDYAILEVSEITLPYAQDDIIYRVLIKKEDNFKILRICNDEMHVVGDYTKP